MRLSIEFQFLAIADTIKSSQRRRLSVPMSLCVNFSIFRILGICMQFDLHSRQKRKKSIEYDKIFFRHHILMLLLSNSIIFTDELQSLLRNLNLHNSHTFIYEMIFGVDMKHCPNSNFSIRFEQIENILSSI